jgi:hypothetical protein
VTGFPEFPNNRLVQSLSEAPLSWKKGESMAVAGKQHHQNPHGNGIETAVKLMAAGRGQGTHLGNPWRGGRRGPRGSR